MKIEIGFFGLLQIVFITLKLCGVIDWEWWAVLLPALICSGFIFGCLFVGLLLQVFAAVFGASIREFLRKRRNKHFQKLHNERLGK